MLRFLMSLCLFVSACNGDDKKAKDPSPSELQAELQQRYELKLAQAKELADEKNGWISGRDCDGALWTGKYSCATGVPKVDMTASEFEGQPGRFGRRPAPACWNEQDGDVGSKTTWSRDMGKGLYRWAWCTDNREALERHASYGVKKTWKMGEPLDDGRVVYTPSMIGELYQLIYAMGGKDNVNRVWPSLYPSGLDDYQAHIQVLGIQIRGEAAEKLGLVGEAPKKPSDSSELVSYDTDVVVEAMDGRPRWGGDYVVQPNGELMLLDVTGTMYARLKEHAERQPNCAYYQYMLGVYDGSMQRALEVLLAEPVDGCDYLRGSEHERLALAEWLSVASDVLKRLEKTNG